MKTRVLKPSFESLQDAAHILRAGGLVGMPTETVYGLGANAFDEKAAFAVFAAKQRPADNPLIVHICKIEQLSDIVASVPENARRLMEAFWPGPLTMILKRDPIVPDRTTGGLDTVGIRCPDHPVTLEIIRRADRPIAAPSANTSGRPSCTRAAEVLEDVGGRIAAVVDGGDCRVGVESTIIDLTGPTPCLLRPGGMPLELLEALCGPIQRDPATLRQMSGSEQPRAPGMKYRHYAPKAPVTVVTGAAEKTADYIACQGGPTTGVICFEEFAGHFPTSQVAVLGPLHDMTQQARNVFSVLRSFDERQVDQIYAQCPESTGLGLAVANRLKKAAGFHVIELEGER